MLRTLLGLVAFSAAVQAVAQAPVEPPPARPQTWQLSWVRNYCVISTGDPASAGVAMWMTPGDPHPDLYFVGSPKLLPRIGMGRIVEVDLLPSGQGALAPVFDETNDSETRVLHLPKFNEALPTLFGQSTAVRLQGLKDPISIAGADKAIATLRSCIEDKLPQWGVDAKAYAALRKPPTDFRANLWFRDDDYPIEALERRDIGDTIARMEVDSTGKVRGCAVVVSSGSKPLDDVTCSTALKRGKFDPAIGPDGQPVAAQRVVRVVFRIGPRGG